MIDTLEFYNYLLDNSIDFFAGVPDSLLANLCACIKTNSPSEKNIITANEGNAVVWRPDIIFQPEILAVFICKTLEKEISLIHF